MSDQPEDPHRRTGEGEGYPPPVFAPAAEPAPTAEPAPAAQVPEPTAPWVVSGEIESGAAASARVSSPAAAPADEPLLPATYSENDLRSAIGSPPMPEHIRPRRGRDRDLDDDDGGDGEPRSRKRVLVVAGSLFAGLGIAALVVLGRLNADRYAVRCEAKAVTAEQGRSFPPWGTSRLGGDAWKPIPIPPSFQCVALETDDPTELGDAYRKMLAARAEALLTAKEKEPAQIDLAAGMLEQALLHARSDSEPHKSARQDIQRMQGDVGYWRATAVLQKAAAELTDAAKQLETAAGQRPRFVSDASAWAAHVRKLIEELRVGPSGAKLQASAPASASAPTPAAPDRPLAPAGVALPIEPGASGGSGDATGSGGDATGSGGEPPPAPSATPGAGIPTGGVLL